MEDLENQLIEAKKINVSKKELLEKRDHQLEDAKAAAEVKKKEYAELMKEAAAKKDEEAKEVKASIDEVKVENTEAVHPNAKDSDCPKSSNHQDEFDDGIPRLPDLGWTSDHGEVDPLERLSKAESAVFDSSKKDLMSDL